MNKHRKLPPKDSRHERSLNDTGIGWDYVIAFHFLKSLENHGVLPLNWWESPGSASVTHLNTTQSDKTQLALIQQFFVWIAHGSTKWNVIIDEIVESEQSKSHQLVCDWGFLNSLLQSEGRLSSIEEGNYGSLGSLTVEQPVDPLGCLYQQFHHQQHNRKFPGVHFTPFNLAKIIIHNTLGLKLEEIKNDIDYALKNNNSVKLETALRSLSDVKVLDPACGSGIFLIVAFREMLSAYVWIEKRIKRKKQSLAKKNTIINRALTKQLKQHLVQWFCAKSPYKRAELKARVVLTHLYGVDLDPVAVGIARANIWLELIKQNPEDYKILGSEVYPKILERLLPYVGLNLIVADALINLAPFTDQNSLKTEHTSKTGILTQTKKRYNLKPTNVNLRRSLKALYKELMPQLQENGSWNGIKRYGSHPAIRMWLTRDQIHNSVNRPFTIICGNPPWGLVREHAKKIALKDLYENQSGQPDLYRYFLELSFTLAKFAIGFITPNTWLDIPAAQKLRESFIKEWNIERVVRVPPEKFENVSANIIWFAALKKGRNSRIHSGMSSKANRSLFNITSATGNVSKTAIASRLLDLHLAIQKDSKHLGEIADITIGYQLYHKDIHTQDEITRKPFHSEKPFSRPSWQEIRAKSITRFGTLLQPDGYILKEANFFRIPPTRFLGNERILVREIPSRKGLVAARISQPFLCPKSVLILLLSDQNYSYEMILCYLNSRLFQFELLMSGEKARQQLFPRISIRTISDLPIPIGKDGNRLYVLCRAIETLVHKRQMSYMDRRLVKLEADLNATVFHSFGLEYDSVENILEFLSIPIWEKKAIMQSLADLQSFSPENSLHLADRGC